MNVDLMCHHGNDLLVVNAARTSFDKQSDKLDEKDIKLINFLAREGHWLPFRHPQVTLRIYAPIFVFRQLDKHQVGFSTSEISRRYVTNSIHCFEPDTFRVRPENIKQGSVEPENPEWWWDQENRGLYVDAVFLAIDSYNKLLDNGVAPEQARAVLPQAMYTTQVKTGSLLGWGHLVKLRTEDHAQKEIKDLAVMIEETISNLYPVSWKAIREYM